MTIRYQAREHWLATAMQKLRPAFSAHGYEIPKNVRVSCGLPSGRAFSRKKRAIGEAWASTASRDKHFEIFISPTIDEPVQVLATLLHELVHVTVGLEAGHKGRFIECARAVGLDAPWTATDPTDEGTARLNALAKKLGKYPHASLDKMTTGKKKQGTRLIKVCCLTCLYTMRIAMTWILVAVPTCPDPDCKGHDEAMDVEIPEAEDEGEGDE